MYSIVQSPNPVLREPTQPVDLSRPDLKKIIEEMKKVLFSQVDPEGVGLAANQVGLPISLFIARWTTKKNEPVHIFINPEIVEHSKKYLKEKKDSPLEGCLSLPKFYGHVKRWEWIRVSYQNEKGERRNEKFENFPSTVIQHEMDHLVGRIFVERILEQDGALYRVSGYDKDGKEKWETVEI